MKKTPDMKKTPEELAQEWFWSEPRAYPPNPYEAYAAGYKAALEQLAPAGGCSDQACHLHSMYMTELARLKAKV